MSRRYKFSMGASRECVLEIAPKTPVEDVAKQVAKEFEICGAKLTYNKRPLNPKSFLEDSHISEDEAITVREDRSKKNTSRPELSPKQPVISPAPSPQSPVGQSSPTASPKQPTEFEILKDMKFDDEMIQIALALPELRTTNDRANWLLAHNNTPEPSPTRPNPPQPTQTVNPEPTDPQSRATPGLATLEVKELHDAYPEYEEVQRIRNLLEKYPPESQCELLKRIASKMKPKEQKEIHDAAEVIAEMFSLRKDDVLGATRQGATPRRPPAKKKNQ